MAMKKLRTRYPRLFGLAAFVLGLGQCQAGYSRKLMALGFRVTTTGAWQCLLGLQRIVKSLEPWGIVLAVVGLFITMIALMIDVEGRQADKTLRAWAIVTSATRQSAALERLGKVVSNEEITVGSGIKAAMEYLNEEKPARLCAPTWMMRVLTAGHTHDCIFPEKKRTVFWGLHLPHAGLMSIDLADAVLVSANLEKAELSGAKLNRARMQNSNLENTVLRGADIRNTKFSRAKMHKTNLSKANGIGSVFQDAQLASSILTRGSFQNANFQGANLAEVVADRANFRGSNLREANLDRASLLGAIIENAEMIGATFVGANLQKAKVQGANLSDAKLRNSNLSEANFRDANLTGASLQGAELKKASLLRARLDGADIRGVRSLSCKELKQAKDWEFAYRDEKLKCGKPIPQE